VVLSCVCRLPVDGWRVQIAHPPPKAVFGIIAQEPHPLEEQPVERELSNGTGHAFTGAYAAIDIPEREPGVGSARCLAARRTRAVHSPHPRSERSLQPPYVTPAHRTETSIQLDRMSRDSMASCRGSVTYRSLGCPHC
jgi:hypothetical protein